MDEILKLLRREIVGAWRFRWWAMIVAWAVCAFGWFAIYSMPDVYEGNAQFYVETESRLDQVIGSVVGDDEAAGQVNLVQQALLGRPVLEKVATETDLMLRAATPQEKNNLISGLRDNIAVTGRPGQPRMPRPDDDIYTISFRDSDRSMALAVVNSLLNEFMDDVVRNRQDSSKDTIEFLESEIADYAQQLKETEQELADFKREHMGLLPGDGGGYFDQLQALRDEIDDLEADLENAQSRRRALVSQMRGSSPNVPDSEGDSTSAPAGPTSVVDARIAEVESQLSELLLRFTERHPDVIAAQEQLAQLEERREKQLEMLRQGGFGDPSVLSNNPVYQQLSIALNEIDVEIAGLVTQLTRARTRVEQLRNQVDTIPEIEAQLTELTRDYDQLQATYDELGEKLELEKIAARKKEAAVVNFRLIDPPYVGEDPVSPQRALMLLAVLVLGLGAGGGVAWLLHMLRPVFHDISDLRESTGFPVLGAVSMTWMERYRKTRYVQLTSFALVGLVLVAAFVGVFVFREPGGVLVRQLLSGGGA